MTANGIEREASLPGAERNQRAPPFITATGAAAAICGRAYASSSQRDGDVKDGLYLGRDRDHDRERERYLDRDI